jgi:hypothetical protein
MRRFCAIALCAITALALTVGLALAFDDREPPARPGQPEATLVPARDGAACIRLENGGGEACGPAADVAAGRLFLITVPAGGEPGQSVVPATGSTQAVVYGYQPDERAGRASIRGTAGQELGSSDVVDGIYRVEITTDAHARRMTEVRFDRADGAAEAPAPIDLD